jgi:hypothetical protein
MSKTLVPDLEKILGTLASLFSEEGKTREVAVLAMSKARIEQTNYDNWNGGQYGYTVYLEVPETLYTQLVDQHSEVEKILQEKVCNICRLYENEWIDAFVLATELTTDDKWREKAKAWVTGQGLTNQGRARSDNLAPRMIDGLLFRSQPEINLYRALKPLGVSFAPLPVFVRGGETYRRIEPDFLIIKEGVVLVVEVDGDTVHRETPHDAHVRATMLIHEGAHLERVNATECETPEKAKACATKLLGVIKKLKTNK